MTGPNKPPRPYAAYKPHGSIPWPALADGTMYRLRQPVKLCRTIVGPDGDEYDVERHGVLQWCEWTDEDGRWQPPDGGANTRAKGKRKAPTLGRWRAVVDWGQGTHEGDRPTGKVWVDELLPDE